MKQKIYHILTLIAATFALLACNEKEPALTGFPITMSCMEADQTKGLLNAEAFTTVKNQIRVYDYLSDCTSIKPAGYYIDGDIAEYNGSSWPFHNKHEWTQDGIHKFFGWLLNDTKGGLTAPSGLSFNTSTHTLTYPEQTLGQSNNPAGVFDFMYSNIQPRNLNTAPDFNAVPLEFSHLFTAFRVTAANNSSNEVYLKKVSFSGLKKRRSATISYAGAQPVVSFIDPVNSGSSQTPDFVYEIESSRYDQQGQGLKLTKTVENVSPNEDFILMWPHSTSDFDNTEILVEYNYKEPGSSTLHTDGSTTIKMKDSAPWVAGKKNIVGLMFRDKLITLDSLRVLPWNKTTENIEFTNQISVSKPITWQRSTISDIHEEEGEVYLYSDTSIYAVCDFHIDTPSGATWTASLIPVEGSSDAFVIEEGYKYGYVGVDSQIRIRVGYSKPIQSKNVAILRITVQTADGRTIIGNIMPSGVNQNVTEYKIIQNLING